MGARDDGESFRRLPDGTVVSQPGSGGQPGQTGTPGSSPPSQPGTGQGRSRLRGCLIAVAAVIGVAVLAVAAVAWLVLRGPEFDERARQTVADEAAAGRVTVRLGDDQPVVVPLVVCDGDALQRLVEGDASDGLVVGGRHAPGPDREVTVQLTGDGRWKLHSDWDGQLRTASVSVTAHRDGDWVRLVDADDLQARVRCR